MHLSSQARQVLAELHAGHCRCNRLELAAHLRGASGFMSHMSRWLGPPARNSRMHDFARAGVETGLRGAGNPEGRGRAIPAHRAATSRAARCGRTERSNDGQAGAARSVSRELNGSLTVQRDASSVAETRTDKKPHPGKSRAGRTFHSGARSQARIARIPCKPQDALKWNLTATFRNHQVESKLCHGKFRISTIGIHFAISFCCPRKGERRGRPAKSRTSRNGERRRAMRFEMPTESYEASLENDIVEIPLLLSGSQMTALETAARHQGLTAGQMVRRLIEDFCNPEPAWHSM